MGRTRAHILVGPGVFTVIITRVVKRERIQELKAEATFDRSLAMQRAVSGKSEEAGGGSHITSASLLVLEFETIVSVVNVPFPDEDTWNWEVLKATVLAEHAGMCCSVVYRQQEQEQKQKLQ